MTIGEKIRMLRTEKGMTQKELCRDHMTRNMLSQIENGIAQPSLSTIYHIASILDIDAGYFISSTDDPTVFKKLHVIDDIKEAYETSDYQACLSFESDELICDAETVLYFYSSAVILGDKAYYEGNYEDAYGYFSKCVSYSSAFPNKLPFLEIAEYHCDICQKALSGKNNDITTPGGDGMIGVLFENSNYDLVLRMIKSGKIDLAAQLFDQLKLSNPVFRMHINARISMASSNYYRARDLLTEMTEQFSAGIVGVSMQYVVYSDLEKCCKAVSDFEGAYNCSIAKHNLSDKFNLKSLDEA